MKDILMKMCEDMVEILMLLHQQGKISESELTIHLRPKLDFLRDVKK